MGRERDASAAATVEVGEEGKRSRSEGGGDTDSSHKFMLDRSKVRILLCDSNPKSSREALELLCKCSYQVTSVKSARQVIDVLNAQGSEIDIILAEVDLPVAKGLKMLKYITKNKELRRIPIIMMSAQDEVSVVVKCLKLGAADYLVKPLRTNELLNLWTHMWRRRKMLGLPEKDVFGHDFELGLSDPSDANTNSTTLLSDETNDNHNKVTDTEIGLPNHAECESNECGMKPAQDNSLYCGLSASRHGDREGGVFSFPKKITLKVGQTSAFFTYVKSSAPSSAQDAHANGNAAPSSPLNREESFLIGRDTERFINNGVQDSYIGRNDLVNSKNICGVDNFHLPSDYPALCLSSSNSLTQLRNEEQVDVSRVPPVFPLSFFYPGMNMMEQNMIPSSGQMFQGSLNDVQAHAATAMLPQYNVQPHCSRMPLMPPFPYHPAAINLPAGHMVAPHAWSSMTNSSRSEVKSGRAEKRAAALVKFRQKRKDRCFEKKIRYVNRKHLAERRPRVRGQFVKQVNNIDLNQNGFVYVDGDSEDDEDNEPSSRELELFSSPEQNASEC